MIPTIKKIVAEREKRKVKAGQQTGSTRTIFCMLRKIPRKKQDGEKED